MGAITPAPTLLKYVAHNIAVGPSSAAETDLINQTLPPFGPNSSVRCTLIGDFLNNTGGTATFTARIYVGGTKVYDGQTATISASTTRRPVWASMLFNNYGATNTNSLGGLWAVGGGVLATTPNTHGALSGNSLAGSPGTGGTAIDTSAAFAFRVSVQLSASSASLDLKIYTVMLEVLP